eukprot:jgi/Mesvir1/28980/Mv17753-RA.1
MQSFCTAAAAAGFRVRLPGAPGISDPREKSVRQTPGSIAFGPTRMIHRIRCLSSMAAPGPLYTSINDKLTKALKPALLVIDNDSHKHAGHMGNPEGKADAETHFSLQIVSEAFDGVPIVKRHRMVYELLAEELGPGKVHALALKTKTPKELEKGNPS